MEEQLPRGDETDIPRTPTLRDIVAPLFRHRQLVVLSFTGILLGAILAGLLLPKEYAAETRILVKRTRIENEQVPPNADVTEAELNSEVELLKSRDLLEKVVLACGLTHSNSKSVSAAALPSVGAEGPGSQPVNERAVAEAAVSLGKKLQVEPVKKTSLISVKYQSQDAELAARVLNTLANLYLEKHVAVFRPTGVFDFFQRETKRYQEELRDAEARLADFSREEGVVSPQLEKEMTLQKLTDFDATLQTTQAAIAETEKRIHSLESQLPQTSPRMTTQIHTSGNTALLQQLKTTLLTLQLKETELLEKFEPDYRPVQEVRQQIAQTKAAIAEADWKPVRDETTDRDTTHEWMRAELAKSKTDLASLQAKAGALTQVVRAYGDRARRIGQKGTVQESLLLHAKAAEENYMLYQRKQEEAHISDALDEKRIVNVAIAEAASVPLLPSGPSWSWTLLMGTLLASVVSVGLAFVSDYLDPSFRTPLELQEYLNLPVLAATPRSGD